MHHRELEDYKRRFMTPAAAAAAVSNQHSMPPRKQRVSTGSAPVPTPMPPSLAELYQQYPPYPPYYGYPHPHPLYGDHLRAYYGYGGGVGPSGSDQGGGEVKQGGAAGGEADEWPESKF